jgi:hypothetical protein
VLLSLLKHCLNQISGEITALILTAFVPYLMRSAICFYRYFTALHQWVNMALRDKWGRDYE